MPLLEKIVHLGESDMRYVPALQMSDLFAWCVDHNHRVMRHWHGVLHGLPWSSLYLDYPRLITPMHQAIELTRSFKLPQRQTTEAKVKRLKPDGAIPEIPDNLIPKLKGTR